MPQSSVEELTARLVAAIDTQGHVNEMTVVTEVVAQLEAMTITAEHLKVTRLGKHINMVRRQLTDSNISLAKRMKKLVKSWQQLLQARSSNGAPPAPLTSTPTNPIRNHSPLPLHSAHPPSLSQKEVSIPSPNKHDASKLTITSSTPQTVKELFSEEDKVTNGVGSPDTPNPAKNRQKLLNLLSKVKRPSNAGPMVVNGTEESQSEVSQSTAHNNRTISETVVNKFSTKNFVSIDENDCSTEQETIASSGKDDDCSSLRVCLPRSAIARTPQTSRKTIHKKQNRHKRLKLDKVESLVVSLPMHLIRLKSPRLPPNIIEVTTCVVNIPIVHYTHRHKKIMGNKTIKSTKHTTAVQTESTLVQSPHKALKTEVEESQDMDIDVKLSQPLPVVELDLVDDDIPTVAEDEAVYGLHTEFNRDCFSETLANRDAVSSVMILPYVYIDGVTDASFR